MEIRGGVSDSAVLLLMSSVDIALKRLKEEDRPWKNRLRRHFELQIVSPNKIQFLHHFNKLLSL